MYTIKFAEELAHNRDLQQILRVGNKTSLGHQETLQADLNSSLIRQMAEEGERYWREKYAVQVRRLRERAYALNVSHALIHTHPSMRPRMVDRSYFVSGLVDARVEELEARLSERQSDFVTPNVFGNAPLYVVGK